MNGNPECKHTGPFSVSFDAAYISDMDRHVMTVRSLSCSVCGKGMQFKGVRAGRSFNEPRVNPTGTTLILPFQPFDGTTKERDDDTSVPS